MKPFMVEANFPPSLAGLPVLAFVTVASFFVLLLICLRMFWEHVEAASDHPAPRGSYIYLARAVRFWLVMTIFVGIVPRIGQLMIWRLLSPELREVVSLSAWVAAVPSAAMLVRTWWLTKRVAATERDYAIEHGYVFASPTTPREKTNGTIMLAVIIVISFAITFVRPGNDVSNSFTVEHRPG